MDEDRLFHHLRARSIDCYITMGKILGALEPIRVGIEVYTPKQTGADDMRAAVEVARRVLRDLPVEPHLISALVTAATDFLVGMVLGRLAFMDDDNNDWKLEAAILALGRCSDHLDIAQHLIDGVIGFPNAHDE